MNSNDIQDEEDKEYPSHLKVFLGTTEYGDVTL